MFIDHQRYVYQAKPPLSFFIEQIPSFPAWQRINQHASIVYMTEYLGKNYELLYYRRASLTLSECRYHLCASSHDIQSFSELRFEDRYRHALMSSILRYNGVEIPRLAPVRDRIIRHLPVVLMEEKL